MSTPSPPPSFPLVSNVWCMVPLLILLSPPPVDFSGIFPGGGGVKLSTSQEAITFAAATVLYLDLYGLGPQAGFQGKELM